MVLVWFGFMLSCDNPQSHRDGGIQSAIYADELETIKCDQDIVTVYQQIKLLRQHERNTNEFLTALYFILLPII